MDRATFCFAVFAALSLMVLCDDDLLLCQRTTENEDFLHCSSNNTFELILKPDNTSHPCESEIVVCGIKTCESKSLPEEIHHTSQSSVNGTDTEELSDEEEQCNCNSYNNHFFIEQEMMREANNHFVKCRVQEDSKNGCKDVLCDWKLINITDTSDNDNEKTLEASDCMCRNTCLAVCQLKTSVRWQDSNIDLFTAVGIMAFVSVASLVICYVFDRCMKREKPIPYVEAREMQTVSPQVGGQEPSTPTECNDNNEGNITADEEKRPVTEGGESGECNVVVHNASKEDDIDDSLLEEILQ